MIRHLLAGVAAAALVLPAMAQNYPDPILQNANGNTALKVANNTALKALAAGKYTTVLRAGFSTAGDGGGAVYNWSSTACSLNSGAGDNGSQVAPNSGTGCWILAPGSLTNIQVWGAKADNTTDIGQFVQAAYNANVGCIRIPAGIYLWSSAVTMAAQVPCFRGDGWNEAVSTGTAIPLSTANMTGTWLHRSSTTFTPVTITTVNGQGGSTGFSDLAFYDDQPAFASGWAPNAYPYFFSVNGSLGRLDFHRMMFYDNTECISIVNAARVDMEDIFGQPEGTCIFTDQQHDVSRLDGVHFWTFYSGTNAYVNAYNEANVNAIVYDRADSPFIDHVFGLGYHSVLAFGQSSNGVTTGAQIGNVSTDVSKYGVWIEPSTTGTQLQIGNLRTAGAALISGPIAGSEGYRDDGSSTVVSIANFDCYYAGSNCLDVEGSGRVDIGNADLWNFDNDNNGSVGLNAGASGWVSLANPPDVSSVPNSAPIIPAKSAGGTYAVRGIRQYWTPTLSGTTGTGTVTYATQVGTFWYDGSHTTLTFDIAITGTLGSGFTGNLTIQGLPLTFNAAAGQNTFCQIGSMSGVTLNTNYTALSGILTGGGGVNQIQLLESASGQSTISAPVGNFGSGMIIEGQCTMAAGS